MTQHPVRFELSWGNTICFTGRQWSKNTPPVSVRVVSPRCKLMKCCSTWPHISNHLTSTQLRRFGIWYTEGVEKALSVAPPLRQLDHFQMKTSWTWRRNSHECAKPFAQKQKWKSYFFKLASSYIFISARDEVHIRFHWAHFCHDILFNIFNVILSFYLDWGCRFKHSQL